jgi:hypothetical protein
MLPFRYGLIQYLSCKNIMSKYIFILFAVGIVNIQAFSQSIFDYEMEIVPIEIEGLPGLHSYAWAQHDGKWLIVGGRKDGLHARQPFNSFPASQNNTELYVIDVQSKEFWHASVNSLPIGIREQLQSTNMNFDQSGNYMYIIGGYAYSASRDSYITFPYLTRIDVVSLIEAIINDLPINSYFAQISNDLFAVTGGHLKKMYDKYYLVGGHRFDGRYNPHGPDHGPGFQQEYTNQIRVFSIPEQSELTFLIDTIITDPVHLHRRDYNLLPQIFSDGEYGLTISSGVFQLDADLPFLYPVEIRRSGHNAVPNFNQYLSNYHSAVATLYDEEKKETHSIFFGGISQYYYDGVNLIQDDRVPFVKTISRLTRDSLNQFTEYLMPLEMPHLQGASAEFIYNANIPMYENKILKLSAVDETGSAIGYVFGGIYSPLLNPFSNNMTQVTQADDVIYEVNLKKKISSVSEPAVPGENPFKIKLIPNPGNDFTELVFDGLNAKNIRYFITDNAGRFVENKFVYTFTAGENRIRLNLENLNQGLYHITCVFDNKFFTTEKLLKLD